MNDLNDRFGRDDAHGQEYTDEQRIYLVERQNELAAYHKEKTDNITTALISTFEEYKIRVDERVIKPFEEMVDEVMSDVAFVRGIANDVHDVFSALTNAVTRMIRWLKRMSRRPSEYLLGRLDVLKILF